ncbi:hypothetical protein NLI96_g3091 [Meripilus lineatus]|uniref:Uncharacterized protein n=1 Tax=Meripilus lineatus TaxID=2056292 RepID=A0AAD5YGY1_9APHY|nr:hypothetical protein NLI96_g3091 [Physisporinus lineatus]
MAQADIGNYLSDILLYLSSLQSDEVHVLQGLAKSTIDSEGDVVGDGKLALLLLAQEAEGLLDVVKEHLSGPSPDPNTLFSELIAREALARYDHEVALAVAEDRPIPPKPTILISHPLIQPDHTFDDDLDHERYGQCNI